MTFRAVVSAGSHRWHQLANNLEAPEFRCFLDEGVQQSGNRVLRNRVVRNRVVSNRMALCKLLLQTSLISRTLSISNFISLLNRACQTGQPVELPDSTHCLSDSVL